jgi:hypothetical protein
MIDGEVWLPNLPQWSLEELNELLEYVQAVINEKKGSLHTEDSPPQSEQV